MQSLGEVLARDGSPLIQPKGDPPCKLDGAWLFDLTVQPLWAGPHYWLQRLQHDCLLSSERSCEESSDI